MVSFWPWKTTDNSPESFEKTLSALSGKITDITVRLENQRLRSRRLKGLWTLYTIFAYLLCVIILTLVVGYRNWDAIEYTALAGGPTLIYIVRQLLDSFYRHRINKTQAALEAFQKERDDTIGKLKEATKYDRTHQLLKKYGGELQPKQSKQTKRPTVPKERGRRDARERASFSAVQDRTGLPPPPTANIPRPMTADAANAGTPTVPAPQQQPSSLQSFSSSMPLTEYSEPKWYDRLLDVLLGEDEMNPRNRLALICVQCRMVNGQAAPGLRTLEEVGPWRCGYCGSWNGKPQGQSRAPSPLLEPPTDDMAGQVRQRSISQPVTSSSPVIEVSPPNDEAVEDGPTPDESETADESNDHDGDHNGKYDDSESSLANGNYTPTKANEGSAEGSIASRTRSKSPRTPNR